MITADEPRLDGILKEILEHSGATTVYNDWLWLQEIQRVKPEWALETLAKYDKLERAKLAK